MDENEFEFEGKTYVAREYFEDDCGCVGGESCAFTLMSSRECGKFKCTPDKRGDGLNVIFLEKNP